MKDFITIMIFSLILNNNYENLKLKSLHYFYI